MPSAMWLRHELPVQRMRTLGFIRMRGSRPLGATGHTRITHAFGRVFTESCANLAHPRGIVPEHAFLRNTILQASQVGLELRALFLRQAIDHHVATALHLDQAAASQVTEVL